MSANYKKLGDYIEVLNRRNTDLKLGLDSVRGISNTKQITETSKATVDESVISKFYVINPDEFVYNPRTTRMGDKVGLAFNNTDKPLLFTFNNLAFKIKDSAKDKLLPNYLYLFFCRSEFDRYARINSWGSATELFLFEDLCNIKFTAPDLKEQEKIVNTYNAITKRIQLKQKINENLEKTAQCLFDKYFKEYNKFYEKEELKTLPTGWRYSIISDFCKDNIKSLSSSDEIKEILYLDTSSITNNKIDELQTIADTEGFPSRAKRIVYDNDIVFSTVRPNLRHFGIIRNPAKNMIVSTGFSVLHNDSEKVSNEFLYMWITNDATLSFLQSIAENSVSTYPSINSDDLMNIKIIIPSDNIISELNEGFRKIFLMIDYNNQEITKLQELKHLVISRISGM